MRLFRVVGSIKLAAIDQTDQRVRDDLGTEKPLENIRRAYTLAREFGYYTVSRLCFFPMS
jgi:hypothetical protein